MRLFIAIELPEWLRERIVRIQDSLRGFRCSIAWVKEENLHITLKFLGDVEEERLESISKTIRRVALSSSPFKLKVKRVGCFPTLRGPRVVWVGVEDSDSLISLKEGIEMALEEIGFEREKRPFHPHITFGRIKKIPEEGWIKKLLSFGGVEMGTFEVCSISLFRSLLKPRGAVYTKLVEATLGMPSMKGGKDNERRWG